MKIFLYIGLSLIVASCNYFSVNSEIEKHDKLISFKSELVMDMEQYVGLHEQVRKKIYDRKRFYSETDTIAYLKDTLYISYLAYVNSCAVYDGNIETQNDTIFLKVYNIGEYACMSGRVDRFTFIIYNPERIEFTIIQE